MSVKRRRCRIFLESFGCSSNMADGEFMAGSLVEAGFELAGSAKEADVLIYNTCGVKTPTENRAIEVLKHAAEMKDKRLLVTGCLPLINPERLKEHVRSDAVLGPNLGSGIVEAVREVVNARPCNRLRLDRVARTSLLVPRKALNPVVSIVPVAQGCLGACSYCCVVFARGHLRSSSADEIAKRVKMDLDSGAREVWLTGQDMAAYGRDIGVNLAALLDEICQLEGDYMVRVGMMTPNLALDIIGDLVEVFQNEHVFKFVHLPVQSGDDQVLKRMNRLYTVSQFRSIVETFRATIPRMTVATDVICGFPGETHADFEESLSLIEEVKPDVVNISKFFPRPRTAAEKMNPKVPPAEVSERSRRMTHLVRRISLEKNRAWLNWKGRILIDEHGKQPDTFIGRNFAYKPIVVKSESESLFGTFVVVRVTNAFQTYLEAEIVD
jgi:threonylcarbamoyladenosine tRNA methylthiotransferase CDKAL1